MLFNAWKQCSGLPIKAFEVNYSVECTIVYILTQIDDELNDASAFGVNYHHPHGNLETVPRFRPCPISLSIYQESWLRWRERGLGHQ